MQQVNLNCLRECQSEIKAWFSQSSGVQLLKTEIDSLNHCEKIFYGEKTVLYGINADLSHGLVDSPADVRCLHGNPITNTNAHFIYSSEDSWPIKSKSVDCLLIHHGLDFSEKPHAILREAERVIVPGGCLVIVGFNLFSLWSGVRFFSKSKHQVMKKARFLNVYRLKDWLRLLGFDPGYMRSFSASYPIMASKMGDLKWLKRLLLNWNFGAFYVMVAVKEEFGALPISSVKYSSGKKEGRGNLGISTACHHPRAFVAL